MAHLLSVQGLVTTFRNEGKEFNAIEDVNLHVDRGEIVGIVGESGSGKSVTMLSVLQLIASPGRVAGGEVYLEGVEGNLLSYGKESETNLHDFSGANDQPQPCADGGLSDSGKRAAAHEAVARGSEEAHD